MMQHLISEILSTRNTIRSFWRGIVLRNVAHNNIWIHVRKVKFRTCVHVLLVNYKTHSGGVSLWFKCARFWRETSRVSVKMELGRNAIKYLFLSSHAEIHTFRRFAPREFAHSFISARP